MGLHLRVQQPTAGAMAFCSEVFWDILVKSVATERGPVSKYDGAHLGMNWKQRRFMIASPVSPRVAVKAIELIENRKALTAPEDLCRWRSSLLSGKATPTP